MANVEKNIEKQKQQKNDGGQQLQRREPSEVARAERIPPAVREPFDLVRDFMRWDPFRALRADFLMRDPFRDMRELMRDMMMSWEPEYRERAWRPEFEVRETDDSYVIRADVPGLASEDLEVSVSGDQLQISGKRERKEEKTEGTYHAYERTYGSFTRTFDLPDSVDAEKIRCELTSGVLEVVLPKKPGAASSRRKIEIKSGAPGAAA